MLLHHRYLEEVGHPALHQLNYCIRNHNEERTEMSLSQLAFSLLGDSTKAEINKLDMNYVLLNFSRSLAKEYINELGLSPPTPQSLNISQNIQEVRVITNTMKQLIQSLLDDTYTSYLNNQIKYKRDDEKVKVVELRFLRRNVSLEVRQTLLQMKHILLEDNNCYNEQYHLLHPTDGPTRSQLTPQQRAALAMSANQQPTRMTLQDWKNSNEM